jgi:Methane oxygenase PmoA
VKLFSFLLLLALALHAQAFDITVAEAENVTVAASGKVVAKLMMAHDLSTPEKHQETYKPFLHVFSADGSTRLTKGPGFQFPHHRGLFLGYNKIAFGGKTYDRWHMKGGDQVVTKITPTTDAFTATIEWQGDTTAPMLVEERRFAFTTPTGPFYLGIEMTSAIKTLSGEAEMSGDPEHAGAQFRPSELVDTTSTTYIFPGEKIDAHKVKDLPWAAEVCTIEGKTFTIIMLNHPENPKGTAISAYRDYGRFGMFPKGTATSEVPFKLRYQWLIAEGDVRDAGVFQKAWNAFAGMNEPTPAITIKASEHKAAKPKK